MDVLGLLESGDIAIATGSGLWVVTNSGTSATEAHLRSVSSNPFKEDKNESLRLAVVTRGVRMLGGVEAANRDQFCLLEELTRI